MPFSRRVKDMYNGANRDIGDAEQRRIHKALWLRLPHYG